MSKSGADPEICEGGGGSLPFPFFPLLLSFSFLPPSPSLLEVGQGLNQLRVWGSAVSSSSGVRGTAPTENEFGAL